MYIEDQIADWLTTGTMTVFADYEFMGSVNDWVRGGRPMTYLQAKRACRILNVPYGNATFRAPVVDSTHIVSEIRENKGIIIVSCSHKVANDISLEKLCTDHEFLFDLRGRTWFKRPEVSDIHFIESLITKNGFSFDDGTAAVLADLMGEPEAKATLADGLIHFNIQSNPHMREWIDMMVPATFISGDHLTIPDAFRNRRLVGILIEEGLICDFDIPEWELEETGEEARIISMMLDLDFRFTLRGETDPRLIILAAKYAGLNIIRLGLGNPDLQECEIVDAKELVSPSMYERAHRSILVGMRLSGFGHFPRVIHTMAGPRTIGPVSQGINDDEKTPYGLWV